MWESITEWLQQDWATNIVKTAFLLLIALGLTVALRRLVKRIESRVSEETTPLRALQRTQTLSRVFSSAGIAVIWGFTLLQTMSTWGYPLGPLLAGVGIVGLAIGFGAQSLVKDVVTGFFILLEDQYGVGDIIEVNQVAAGKVEQLTLRVTGMRGLDGTLHYISNGNITHVANRSKDWARAVIDVGVAYKEDPDRVRAVLESVAREAKDDPELGSQLYAVPEILGVEMLGEYQVTWRMTAETKPGRQWNVSRDLRERVKVAFDRNGIEIPFPHRVMVYAKPPAPPEAEPDSDATPD